METDGSRVCPPAPFRWLFVAASCAVSHGITAQESSIPTVLTKQFNICPHCRAKKLGADELARSAAAVPSGGPDDMAPLTPSHSLHRELTSRPKSPALPCDVSSLNHMPRTPCTPAVYEQDGDAEMTDTTSAAAITMSSSAVLGVDLAGASTAANEMERESKHTHTTPAGARAHEDDCFLGAVHSLELTRLQTYGKLEAAHLPFDPACLRSLRVVRIASDDMLAEGALEALLEGLDPAATPQVHILKCHFATK